MFPYGSGVAMGMTSVPGQIIWGRRGEGESVRELLLEGSWESTYYFLTFTDELYDVKHIT